MNHKNLILVGGGGHCKSVIDVALNAGWTILGILDVAENVGKKVLDYSIIGTDEHISEFVHKTQFLVTVGHIKNVELRVKLHEKIVSAGGKLATVFAHDAHISNYSEIDQGTIVMHKAIVNAGAKIGMGSIINNLANIEHDAVVGSFCHISTGAIVNGGCNIGDKTFIGSGSVVINNISIATKTIIAAGSVVCNNIVESGTYAGNPSLIKNNK